MKYRAPLARRSATAKFSSASWKTGCPKSNNPCSTSSPALNSARCLENKSPQGSGKMKQFATITVIGRDKTGVVARVTGFLFEHKANIEGLEEQVIRGQFSMVIQASWRSQAWCPQRV